MKVRAKLHSLGTKRSDGPETAMPMKQRVEVTFPSLTLNSAQVAEVAKLQRGDKCRIILEAEVKGTREAERWDSAGKNWQDAVVADFELKKGGIEPVERKHASSDEAYEAAKKEM